MRAVVECKHASGKAMALMPEEEHVFSMPCAAVYSPAASLTSSEITLTAEGATMSKTIEPHVLMTGLAFGESPRWHNGRLWFCNWTAQEIVAVDPQGKSEVVMRLPFSTFPFSVDWLP